MKKKQTEKAFSIVEVLLSIFVLSMGLTVVARLLVGAYSESIENRNAIIAVQLAQEGHELVRNFRDNNIALGYDPFLRLDTTDSRYRCPRINNVVNTATMMQCMAAGDYRLFRNTNLLGGGGDRINVYTYVQGSGIVATPFSRRVTIDKTDPNLQVVRTVVAWGSKTIDQIEALSGGIPENCNTTSKCAYIEGVLSSTGWE